MTENEPDAWNEALRVFPFMKRDRARKVLPGRNSQSSLEGKPVEPLRNIEAFADE